MRNKIHISSTSKSSFLTTITAKQYKFPPPPGTAAAVTTTTTAITTTTTTTTAAAAAAAATTTTTTTTTTTNIPVAANCCNHLSCLTIVTAPWLSHFEFRVSCACKVQSLSSRFYCSYCT